MSNIEKKIYRVLKPIAWGGRREIGETLALLDEEAANLGGEYVALESAPATAGVKVEDEASRQTPREKIRKKSKK